MKELVELYVSYGWAVPWGLLAGALTAGGFAIGVERDKARRDVSSAVSKVAQVGGIVIDLVDHAGTAVARQSRDLINQGAVVAAISKARDKAHGLLYRGANTVIQEVNSR